MADPCARAVTLALGGRWHAGHGAACCPAHDDRTPSLSLAQGHDGRLLVHCHAGCDWRAVRDALRDRGLLPPRGRAGGTVATDPQARAARERAAARHAARRSAQALACWAAARPVAGTPAEAYLRGRAITADLPDTLRFHPAAWHGPTATRRPALIARVDGGPHLAVHRTFLTPDGRRADVSPPKMMLGHTRGGAVQVAHAPAPRARLVVAEGLETVLALASGLLGTPATVWAALSTAGVAALHLPPTPGRLVVAPDGDEPGRAAADTLAARACSQGWRVTLLPAPEGDDWADVQALRAHASSLEPRRAMRLTSE